MRGPSDDPVVHRLRQQISETDRLLLETLNRRLELVRELRDHKEERGYPFVDRSREAALVEELLRENPGPLSAGALRELYALLLEVMKREAARLAATADSV